MPVLRIRLSSTTPGPSNIFTPHVTQVDRLATRSRALTLREVLMKRHNVLKVRLGVGTSNKRTRSQPDELWIRKTNAVIA